MVDLAGFSGLEIFLGVAAFLTTICAISWVVRCAVGHREAEPNDVAADADGKSERLLNKEVVIDVPVPAAAAGETSTNGSNDVALCAICKGMLADSGGSAGGCVRVVRSACE
ncbi:uncharacterized protein LOC121055896 [Oryza brachyantha]|uniref:uncharacterized protein LOC121055896 n=1 Tax=Oryza brachyantha TaxID=4533 RepID=UPI001ADCA98F|nr:uncharacterized protein LOC121055896 [Oryza brachyantha]